MPYKHNGLFIPEGLDRRRRLSADEREEIKRLYFTDFLSIREIARRFETKCSRRLIQFILFPERLETVNYPGHWAKYYDKDKHAKSIKKHRRYKQSLKMRDQLKGGI